MAVPITLEILYVTSTGIIINPGKEKASYFIAATEEDLVTHACVLDSPLTPKSEYSNGPYTIYVI